MDFSKPLPVELPVDLDTPTGNSIPLFLYYTQNLMEKVKQNEWFF
jgi:hypothetical protein